MKVGVSLRCSRLHPHGGMHKNAKLVVLCQCVPLFFLFLGGGGGAGKIMEEARQWGMAVWWVGVVGGWVGFSSAVVWLTVEWLSHCLQLQQSALHH